MQFPSLGRQRAKPAGRLSDLDPIMGSMRRWEEELWGQGCSSQTPVLTKLAPFRLQHPGCLASCLMLSFTHNTGYPTCSRSLSLFDSSISERKGTLPSGQKASPQRGLRGPARTTGVSLFTGAGQGLCRLSLLSCPIHSQRLKLLVWKHTQKNKFPRMRDR